MLPLQQTIQFSDYSELYDLIIPQDNLLRRINDLVDFFGADKIRGASASGRLRKVRGAQDKSQGQIQDRGKKLRIEKCLWIRSGRLVWHRLYAYARRNGYFYCKYQANPPIELTEALYDSLNPSI